MKSAQMRRLRSAQGGVMLLEALIGLLIFSLGVLALVAMQSVSISNVSNAKYRVEAAFLAEEIMNYMWLDPNSVVASYSYPGGNSPYLMNWVTRVQSTGGTGLPGALTYPPTIVIVPQVFGAAPNQQTVNVVTVTIRWKAPDALTPSNHIAMTYISPP
jgi:type IV pilus assembly protein PilV